MQTDIKPLLRGEKDSIDFSFELTLNSDDIMPNVSFPRPFTVDGTIVNNGGYISLSAKAKIDYDTVCARCLKELHGTLEISYEKPLATEGTLVNEDTDDYIIICDGTVDIDESLSEQVILEFPTKLLCSDECRGICPVCGHNLNDGDCSCNVHETDPRLAVLAKHKNDFIEE